MIELGYCKSCILISSHYYPPRRSPNDMQLEPRQCKILQYLRMLEINHSPAPCAMLMLLIVNLKLELPSSGTGPLPVMTWLSTRQCRRQPRDHQPEWVRRTEQSWQQHRCWERGWWSRWESSRHSTWRLASSRERPKKRSWRRCRRWRVCRNGRHERARTRTAGRACFRRR
jgi:hypothetical protein